MTERVIPVGEPLDFEQMVKTQVRAAVNDPQFVAEKLIAIELALNEMSQIMKDVTMGCRELDRRICELEAQQEPAN